MHAEVHKSRSVPPLDMAQAARENKKSSKGVVLWFSGFQLVGVRFGAQVFFYPFVLGVVFG